MAGPTPLIATAIPEVVVISIFGSLAVTLVAILAVLTVFQVRSGQKGRAGRIGLGCLALCCGPAIGAAMAIVDYALGRVHPDDFYETVTVYATIGTLVGVPVGLAFVLATLIPTTQPVHDAKSKEPPDWNDET